MFGIITICIILCIVWCCCLSPDAKARRSSSSTHERDNGDVVHRDVEVIVDSYGNEEVVVHEEVEHRGRRDSRSGSDSGDDREFNQFKQNHQPGVQNGMMVAG